MSVNSGNTQILDRGTPLAADGNGDLQLVLGSGNLTKSYFFGTATINRWSLRKPVIHTQAYGPLTDTQMGEVNCGLTPRSLTKMLYMSNGYSGSHSNYSAADCIAQIAQWNYARPSGTSAQPWRTLDFYPYSSTSGAKGYNKSASAPDSGWAGKTLSLANLQTLAAVTETITGSGNAFVLAPSNTGFLYETFNVKFGQSSSDNWGDTTNMEIPITWVTGLTGNWRLAIAVWVPSGSYGAWNYFIGRRIVKDYLDGNCNMGAIMPDFASNPAGAEYMRAYVASNGYTEFSAAPVFVKDINYTYVNINGQKFMPQVVAGTSAVYCMPSGKSDMKIAGGTPTYQTHYSITTSTSSGTTTVKLKNTDTANSHTYTYNTRHGTTILATVTRTIAKNTTVTVLQGPTSNNPNILMLEEDGHPI